MPVAEAMLLAVQLGRLSMDLIEAANAKDDAAIAAVVLKAREAVLAADAAWVKAGEDR